MHGQRKIILQVLLWSLGVSAVAGVVGILAAPGSVGWQIIWTGLCAAVGALLLLPLSLLVDRERTRASGLLGMIIVTTEFLLIGSLIWRLPRLVGWNRLWDALCATAWVTFALGVVAMGLLRARRSETGRVASWVGLVACVIAFGAFMVAAWAYRDDEPWLAALTITWNGALITGSFAGPWAPCLWWRWLGAACAAIGGALIIFEILDRSLLPDEYISIPIAISVVLTHANLMMLVPLRPGQGWLLWATIAAATFAAGILDVMIFADPFLSRSDGALARVAGAAGVLAACGTLALMVLGRLNRRVEVSAKDDPDRRIAIVCPRCRREQAFRIGGDHCAACGLMIDIRMEDPGCRECGYSLEGLAVELCPECGTPVRLAGAADA